MPSVAGIILGGWQKEEGGEGEGDLEDPGALPAGWLARTEHRAPDPVMGVGGCRKRSAEFRTPFSQ